MSQSFSLFLREFKPRPSSSLQVGPRPMSRPMLDYRMTNYILCLCSTTILCCDTTVVKIVDYTIFKIYLLDETLSTNCKHWGH
jgi:hypothetical protein